MKRVGHPRAGLIASFAIAVALVGAHAAGAAIDPVSDAINNLPTQLPTPVEDALDVPTILDTPTATAQLGHAVDTLGDAVTGVVDGIGGTSEVPVDGEDDTSGGSTSGSGDSGANAEAPGAKPKAGGGTRGTRPVSGETPAAGARESIAAYAATAARAAAATARRAINLAGPFGAPIGLTILILAAFLAVGTGSDRLVRVENLAHKRVYRL
ncbi:MAG: hypothetical protein WDA27_11320 [Actinomycetota bacterium]